MKYFYRLIIVAFSFFQIISCSKADKIFVNFNQNKFKHSESQYCEATLVNVFSGIVNGCVARINNFDEITIDNPLNNKCRNDSEFGLLPGEELTIGGLKNLMGSLPGIFEIHKVKGINYGYLNNLNPKTGMTQNINFSAKLKRIKNDFVGMTETGLFLRIMRKDKLRVHGGFGLLEFNLNCYPTKYDAYTNTLNNYFLDDVKLNYNYNFIDDAEYKEGFGGARSMIGGRLFALEYKNNGDMKVAELDGIISNYWKGIKPSKVIEYNTIKNEKLEKNFYSKFVKKMKEKKRVEIKQTNNKEKYKEGTIETKPIQSDFSVKPLTINFPTSATKRDDIAVIISNANYKELGKDIPNVNPAYADAEGIKQYFMEAKGIKEGNIIYLKDATGSQLLGVFGNKEDYRGQLFNYIKPHKSNVYVYYVGHGAPSGPKGSAYIIPSDANAQTLSFSGYPLSTLYSNLGKLPAKTVTVILEACFSGASQAGSLFSKSSPVIPTATASFIPKNVKVIAAGSETQMASWEEDSSHSLFTKYFLKAMSGEGDANEDGKVSDNELKEYLSDTMTYYARRYYGRDQKVQIHNGK